MKVHLGSLALLGLIFGNLFAQVPQKQVSDPCANPQNTVQMRDCASKQYQEADAELNRTYKKVMSALDDNEQKALLQKAQKAWLQYRDAYADFKADLYRGGTIAPQIKLICLTDITKARSLELLRTYNEDLKN